MILEIEPLDRGKPEWPSCVYREVRKNKRFCTNGFAIEYYGLPRTTEIKKLEVGVIHSPGICESCSYKLI